jgi:hypothetical protein
VLNIVRKKIFFEKSDENPERCNGFYSENPERCNGFTVKQKSGDNLVPVL